MYSFPNFEPVHCSMSGSNWCSLTCKWDSQETGKVVWYPHLFKNFLQFVVIHTVKGFSIVTEAEVDVFVKLKPLLSPWSNDCWQIWSLVPLPFLNSAYISESSQFTDCWSLAWRILSTTFLACEMRAVVWTFFYICLLWDWNEYWPFPIQWPLLSFPNLLTYWV